MTPDIIHFILLLFKLLMLLAVGLYSIFALIMIRQEQLMAQVLEESFEPILKLLTILHFALSIGLFFLALFLL